MHPKVIEMITITLVEIVGLLFILIFSYGILGTAFTDVLAISMASARMCASDSEQALYISVRVSSAPGMITGHNCSSLQYVSGWSPKAGDRIAAGYYLRIPARASSPKIRHAFRDITRISTRALWELPFFAGTARGLYLLSFCFLHAAFLAFSELLLCLDRLREFLS